MSSAKADPKYDPQNPDMDVAVLSKHVATRKFEKLMAHLNAAKGYAALSYAERLKVGAVLVRDDRIISTGYNGMPPSGSNVCEHERIIRDGEKFLTELVTKPEVIHAEENSIAYAARDGVSTDGCTMVTTHSPCYECSKLIISAGIKTVYYDEEYRDNGGIEFLRKYGVTCERISE